MSRSWKDVHAARRYREIVKSRRTDGRRSPKLAADASTSPYDIEASLAELDRLAALVAATRDEEIVRFDAEDELAILETLLELSLTQGVPFDATQVHATREKKKRISRTTLRGILEKFHVQRLIVADLDSADVRIISVEDVKIQAILEIAKPKNRLETMLKESGALIKRKRGEKRSKSVKIIRLKDGSLVDVNAYVDVLLTIPSAKESASRKVGDELQELLTTPSVKEKRLMEKFKSQGGTQASN